MRPRDDETTDGIGSDRATARGCAVAPVDGGRELGQTAANGLVELKLATWPENVAPSTVLKVTPEADNGASDTIA